MATMLQTVAVFVTSAESPFRNSLCHQVPMPHQILPALDGVCIAIGNDKEVVCYGRDGVIVVVGEDDTVVPGSLPDHGLNILAIHWI